MTTAMTAVFARQVQALGRPGDVLVGISTSGRSKNVVLALGAAKAGDITTVALTGSVPRDMAGADYVLAMPATETAKMQELQLVAGHIVFALVEQTLSSHVIWSRWSSNKPASPKRFLFKYEKFP